MFPSLTLETPPEFHGTAHEKAAPREVVTGCAATVWTALSTITG